MMHDDFTTDQTNMLNNQEKEHIKASKHGKTVGFQEKPENH